MAVTGDQHGSLMPWNASAFSPLPCLPAAPDNELNRILLVEDSPQDVVLIQETVTDTGIARHLVVCATVASAVNRLAIGGIDVILPDLCPSATALTPCALFFGPPRRCPWS